MAELGFFRQAAADPDRVALVGPDGTEVTAGALAARANQVSHGLRALGLERGDTVAGRRAERHRDDGAGARRQQIGLYMTPINHHLVGPEIAYIVNDSDAKVLIGHERFADALAAAGEEIKLGPDRLFKIGSIPGGPRLLRAHRRPADIAAENRTAGAPMHYTSGTTGQPKGVKRKLCTTSTPTRAARCTRCS